MPRSSIWRGPASPSIPSFPYSLIPLSLRNVTELDLAWPSISNPRALAVSQCWEAERADPSGALMKVWQAETIPAVVAGCSAGCSRQCVDQNSKCSRWAKDNQCVENPGYMRAVCPASCPQTSEQIGWKLTSDGGVQTPAGDCLDTAAQLPSVGSSLNWLRTRKCDPSSVTQRFEYQDHELVSNATGMCLGVESHWLWPQPMVSLVGCGGAKTNLTLHKNGTLSSQTDFGCFGVSSVQGPPSSIWRKPLPNGKTAVLAINGAALPHEITIDVAAMLAPDYQRSAGTTDTPMGATITDIWTGQSLGKHSNITRNVKPHSNIFVMLE